MKLISREFEFERPLQPGVQSRGASPASGWDPYDVWSTRVRSQWAPIVELPSKLRIVPDVVVSPEKPAAKGVNRVAGLYCALVILLHRRRHVTAIKTASPP